MSDGKLFFTTATTLTAATPYLVKPQKDIDEPLFADVTIATADNGEAVSHNGYDFVPALYPVTLVNDRSNVVLTSKGSLAYPSSRGTAVGGCHAYLRFPTGQSAKLSFYRPSATAITTVETPAVPRTVYNTQGQRLTHPRRGLNIVGGRKEVRR